MLVHFQVQADFVHNCGWVYIAAIFIVYNVMCIFRRFVTGFLFRSYVVTFVSFIVYNYYFSSPTSLRSSRMFFILLTMIDGMLRTACFFLRTASEVSTSSLRPLLYYKAKNMFEMIPQVSNLGKSASFESPVHKLSIFFVCIIKY